MTFHVSISDIACLCLECRLRLLISEEADRPDAADLEEVIQSLGNIFSEALAELPHGEAMLALAALPAAVRDWREHHESRPTGVLS